MTPAFDRPLILAFLAALLDPAAPCCEVRLTRARRDFRSGRIVRADTNTSMSGWFDDPLALYYAITEIEKVSAYVTVNPVHPDLLLRFGPGKLVKVPRDHATHDREITALRWLYLDIDPARPAGISATAAEHRAALDRRDAILADLPDVARASLWGSSGNGAWVLARLPDWPVDEGHGAMVEGLIRGIAGRYSDGSVKVDTATKNASRVMCLPGTVKCKGQATEERPWRPVTLDGGWGT